jgi:hypothetical protein
MFYAALRPIIVPNISLCYANTAPNRGSRNDPIVLAFPAGQ